MDVLFGVVSVESRRRDRLVVRNNLMGSVYDDSTPIYPYAGYPLESKSTTLSPNSQTSVHQMGTSMGTAIALPESDDVEAEANSLEKVRYTWTIPE